MQLKILSWNIWYDCKFQETIKFLKTSNADIIGLQEVVSNDLTRDVIGYLKKFGYDHVFSPALKLEDDRTVGNAIFSKYKIIKNEVYNLSEEKSRNAVKVEVNINRKVLNIFNTHLLHTHQKFSAIQDTQVDSLIKVLPSDHLVLMGDFNAIPDSSVIRKMRDVLVDTDPSSKPTWSIYPEGCPTCNPQALDTRLDYIFTSKDMKTHSFNVEQANGSDHLPISVFFEI